MLPIPNKDLTNRAKNRLEGFTSVIIGMPDYSEQKAKAESLWDNKSPKFLYEELRITLASMCNGVKRCMYCEDAEAKTIEHRRPKSLFPRQTFDWDNLLFSCGNCNSKKSNKFAILIPPISLEYVEITEKNIYSINHLSGYVEITEKNIASINQESGIDAVIDPRKENPMDLLSLVLEDPFYFLPRLENKDAINFLKATYTILILDLNNVTLSRMRRLAFQTYLGRLKEYGNDKKGKYHEFQEFLQESYHRTVWEEMKRQHSQRDDLRDLFQQAPEVLAW